jgi:hypothetical protein
LLGLLYFFRGRYDLAISQLNQAIILAAAYVQSGRAKDAEREARGVLRLEFFSKLKITVLFFGIGLIQP